MLTFPRAMRVGLLVTTVCALAAAPASATATCGWTMFYAKAPGSVNGVSASATNDAWAVGSMEITTSGAPVPVALHGKGHGWKTVTLDPVTSYFNDVVDLSRTNAWAVGDIPQQDPYVASPGVVEHWDGVQGSTVPTPTSRDGWSIGDFEAVSATSATDVWVVGRATNAQTTQYGAAILHYDGSTWSVTGSPFSTTLDPVERLHDVLALSPSDVWAVGDTSLSNGRNLAILHYDGNTWSVVKSGPQGELQGLGASSSGNVWSIGFQEVPSGLISQSFAAERWDGQSWTATPPLTLQPDYGLVLGLQAAGVVSATDVFVSYRALGSENFQVSHWDGAAWTIQSIVDPAAVISAKVADLTTIPGTNEVWATGVRGTHNPKPLLAEVRARRSLHPRSSRARTATPAASRTGRQHFPRVAPLARDSPRRTE